MTTPSWSQNEHPEEEPGSQDKSLQRFLMQVEDESGQRLLHRLTEFGRLLWESGIAVGPHQLIDLAETLNAIDISKKEDFYATLKCSLVTRHEQEATFDQLFDYFWLTRPHLGQQGQEKKHERYRKKRPLRLPPEERKRLAEHLNATEAYKDLTRELKSTERKRTQEDLEERNDNDLGDPSGSIYSALEQFRNKDFDSYTWEEIQEAKRMMSAMRWHLSLRQTHRKIAATNGHYPDLRHMLRHNMRNGAEMLEFAWRKPRRKPRPLVIICDISGSMSLYSRLLLHFIHTISNGHLNVESFVFGTRLTRITRQLHRRDVDDAIKDVTRLVQDWSGGTRIGDALYTFNYYWSRRVLGHGAIVLVISDGWDRGDPEVLKTAMDRLQHSCHHLIWLNPLLDASDYRPLTSGMKAALPYIDDFLPAHNLNSLIDLGHLLSDINDSRPDRNSVLHQKKVAEWSKNRYHY